jgi:iron complex transport system substrate-binding protein
MIPDRYDGQGIVDKIKAVGVAIGAEGKAADFASKVSADLEDAEQLTAGIEQRKRVLFILSLQGGKIMASGAHTAANGIIHMAGAENAIEGFDGYRPLNDEAVISARPDVVMMMNRGDGSEIPDDEIFAHPAIAATPAGQDRRIVRMDGLYLLGFGPRTAEAVRDLARSLYGDGVSN